jgi:hypothetical protein
MACRSVWRSRQRPQLQALGGTADVALQEIFGYARDVFPELPKDDPLKGLAKKRFSQPAAPFPATRRGAAWRSSSHL